MATKHQRRISNKKTRRKANRSWRADNRRNLSQLQRLPINSITQSTENVHSQKKKNKKKKRDRSFPYVNKWVTAIELALSSKKKN